MAGVNHGNVVLVGKRQLTAVKLADGKPAWKPQNVELPPTAMPSGRGFMTGDNYYLPLTTAEVARIDLNSAKITAEAKSRKGTIPGNLVCFQGEVISQGIDYVETFFQLEPLQQRIAAALEKNPNDTWALAHRGEIELDDGRIDDAIVDVRKAYQAEASPFNRDMLIEALIAGLTKDFQKHKSDVDDLEQLVQLDHERAAFLRVLASGLQKNGNTIAALDAYLKLAGLDPQTTEPEDIDPNFAVTRAAWIRAQFQSLLTAAAKPEDRAQIDAALAQQLKQSVAAGSIKQLQRFLDCFGDHPSADQARELLAVKLTGPESFLQREMLLRQLQRSTDDTRRASASAQLAGVLSEAGQVDDAVKEYRSLEASFGEKPVLSGKNVKQILAGLPADSPLRAARLNDRPWPEGEVKIERGPARPQNLPGGMNRMFPLELRGNRGPYFQDVTVGFTPDNAQIIGYDGLGKEQFRVGLNDNNQNIGYFQQPGGLAASASAQGHVLIVSTGTQVIAIDTLKPPAGANNRVLWRKDLTDTPNIVMYPPPMIAAQPWGGRRIQMRTATQPIGNVGPCTESVVCYQRGRDVYAVDLLSGNTLWVRHGIEPGCDIFGDDEVLILASPTEAKAWALRTADGELLGDCQKVPSAEQRWTTLGRCLLSWRPKPDGGQMLVMQDLWEQRELWTENFSAGVQGAIVDGEAAALLQPDGKFVMLALADGKKLINEQLEKEQNLKAIYVERSASQDILLTARNLPGSNPNRFPANGQGYNPMGGFETRPEINGNVYAFDRSTGKPMWPAQPSSRSRGRAS